MNIEWKPLPFFSRRWVKPKMIIVHWSAGYTLQSAFDNLKKNGTSYHYMVDGGTIWSLVEEGKVAYHAGNWIANVNSVGVCHVAIYEQPVKEESYATSGQLLAEICKRNGFEPESSTIRPHREFKATACPGSLDINRLIGEARKFYFGLTPEVIPQPVENPVENPAYPKNVTTGENIRVRKESNTHSPIYRVIDKNTSFQVIGEQEGENINGNSRWYDTGNGYVSSAYVKE